MSGDGDFPLLIGLRRKNGVVDWVVGVPSFVKCVERSAVVIGEWKSFPYAERKIRIGDEVTTESDCVHRSGSDDLFCGV